MVALAANPPFHLAPGHFYGLLENSGNVAGSVVALKSRTVAGPPWQVTLPEGSAIEIQGDDIVSVYLVSGSVDYGQDIRWRLPSAAAGGGGAATVPTTSLGAIANYVGFGASATMFGCGSIATITPKKSGIVKVTFTFYTQTGPSNSEWQGAYGTGAAPAQGAAATGTTVATLQTASTVTIGTIAIMPAEYTMIVSGLALGTAYWFDLQVIGDGASNEMLHMQVAVEELPW